ncbi:MAG: hypothetical protein ABI647_02325 [Gemmatimonadota bacterium]
MKSVLRAAVVALPLLAVSASRPDLYKIPLEGTGTGSRLAGTAFLSPARSPFGIAMTPDGFFVFDIDVDVPVLPPVSAFGAEFKTYMVWLATADLEQVKRLGPLTAGTRTRGKVAMNKFLVVITAERVPNGEKWAGPIVMRGRSPSAYLTNFSGHTMFNGGVPQ